MAPRIASITILAAFVLSGLLPSAVAADTALPLPATMGAVGDSITQAASTGGTLGADAPQNSWSTGTSGTVNSHYLRLVALGAPINQENHNLSVSGAKMAGLNTQMQNVVGLQPDYLTVLIGGNDLCTDTVAGMTSVTDFRAQLLAAMTTLTAGSPNTNIYVVSIPDAYQLWNLFNGDFWARFIWSVGSICQSLLANPTSTQQADVQRRQQVRQRNIDYNTQLAEVCATFASQCRFDNNAVFNTQFTKSDISGDYFHPSVAGQAKLASVSWSAGYSWATSSPPNVAPSASFTSSCSDLVCTFTDASTDSDGVIAARAWTFGDGATSTATNPSHTYAAAGTYTVRLTVTDDDGATASASSAVTASTPPAIQTMWVGSLAATTTSARKTWTATVTIQVVGGSGPVGGVWVAGSWSAGSGATTCTTDTGGRCSVTSSTLNKTTTTVTFTVTGLTRNDWAYDPTRNVRTKIAVAKP
jgi:PKD repeat protein